ncbi:hypothetical protein [Endozoicomonas sp. GU-1]|uniref:hypothetical protein n=1 Tax=Endozoicomonas sp. GU-1 TaxID=3009078 RepID=UPI0022B4340F|nr:hypothetical protein [Endozoicomonas sp. GU-1]WBA82851.1 hypothetical protein O2T12_06910 [Endozoicomonas sp. GU-1]WBA85779.1 hypothetical protein O3276_21555 [Endozoicomonas sp. GU-1]
MLLGPSADITSQFNIKLRENLNNATGQMEGNFKGRLIISLEGCYEKNLVHQVYQGIKDSKSVKDTHGPKEKVFHPARLKGLSSDHYQYMDMFGSTVDLGRTVKAPIVKFDKSCKLANEVDVRIRLAKNNATESMANFVCSNLKKMATLGNWSGQSVPMSVTIVRYTLNSDNPEIVNIPWNTGWAPLTMSSVISPCKQKEGAYSGGDLLFAETEHIPETVKQYSYPENGCIVTENVFSIGTASDIKLVSGESCQRMVVTFSAYPDKQQFLSFMEKNSGQNLLLKDSPDIS